MADWFTADTHFGHQAIIGYCKRPFVDVEEMNAELIRRWNAAVKPTDTIYCLGDFSLSARVMDEITPQLNGKKVLVRGNHDLCHPVQKNWANKMLRYGLAGWAIRASLLSMYSSEDDLDSGFRMCHMPYEPVDDRYPEYTPPDRGHWLLHGHVHREWKIKGKQINVGVDVWDYAPVSWEQIRTLPEVVESLGH